MAPAPLPGTDFSPFLRTDFTDDGAWRELVEVMDRGAVSVLADRGHEGLPAADLQALVPDDSRYPVLVVADGVTFSSPERPLLLIDVADEPGRTFRAVPDACESAVGNLAIGNLGFDDYLASLDESGVHRLSDRHRKARAELERSARRAAATRSAGPHVPGRPQATVPGPGFARGTVSGRPGARTSARPPETGGAPEAGTAPAP